MRGNSLLFQTVGQFTHWMLPHGTCVKPWEHFIPVHYNQSAAGTVVDAVALILHQEFTSNSTDDHRPKSVHQLLVHFRSSCGCHHGRRSTLDKPW